MPSMPTLPSHVDILRTLVGTPSVSSPDPGFDQSNRGVVDHLAEFCEQLGFRVEVTPLVNAPHKANLIATLGPADQPGGLVFSGHTDTVPFDRDAWQTDPFTLTVGSNGSLFGLGVADMKGFFPCALHAIRTLGEGALKKPVVLVATADEESTMWGAQQLVSEGRRLGRHAIIGEPTGMRPVRKHKGVMMERVLLEGHSGHSSDPSLGRNAIEGMGRVIEALGRVRADFASRYHDASFSVPSPTLNLGKVFGGDSPNRICARCELYFDVRPLPVIKESALPAKRIKKEPAPASGAQFRKALEAGKFGVDMIGKTFEGMDKFIELLIVIFHLEKDDFELDPFNKNGGLGRMWQLFGEGTEEIINELNEVLAA